ncbi:MAG: hypothetical protein K2R98_18465 [Gemmataceae bacterium]|nr:hypothetical protein [Gemmataceae bacterium]
MYRHYDDVPRWRRHAVVSRWLWVATGCGLWFQLLGPITTVPFAVWLAAVLFTGDVYYEVPDAEGQLKRWSVANKFATAFLVLLNGWLLWKLHGE